MSDKPTISLVPCVLTIQAKHIRQGVRSDSERCPIALALREKVKASCHVLVTYENINIENGIAFRVQTTREQQHFIDAFDFKKSSVKPQTFTMLVPSEFLK